MSSRLEFVEFADAEDANIRELCRRYEISPKTGYKWIHRYQEQGLKGLEDASRRPKNSPNQTPPEVEAAVVRIRQEHPAWGGRKIRWQLNEEKKAKAKKQEKDSIVLPSASTITEILRRHELLDPQESAARVPYKSFEHPSPNCLWQMDFKGHFPLAQGRCYPLSVLDDHSRFSVGMEACGNERGSTVQSRLTPIFRRYGLPDAMLMDNGSPWGSSQAHPYTPLVAWLMRLGIRVIHSAAYHPQTQGKVERFHRTLKAEALRHQRFTDLASCQSRLSRWRIEYNTQRPHEALGMQVPASRYQPSDRAFPEVLPPIEYPDDALVRKVQSGGQIHLKGRVYHIPKAFRGYPVGLRLTTQSDVYDVFFCHQKIAQIHLSENS